MIFTFFSGVPAAKAARAGCVSALVGRPPAPPAFAAFLPLFSFFFLLLFVCYLSTGIFQFSDTRRTENPK